MELGDIEKEYFRLRPDLYRFLLSKTRSHEWAEDILQDTIMEIIEIYQKSDSIFGATFKSFLYKVAYNKFIDDTRKSYKKLEVSTEALENDWEQGKIDQTDYSELIFKTVNNILTREDVDLRVREVLKLRLIDRWKIEDISNFLSLTRQTIHSDYRKGMELLRFDFEELNLKPEDLF
ncbi:RNA polymerase sigma factor [Leptospira sp. GIMC2001]|uniref:RNA polymerase sigma factor n=1 Tax=Leptospira sp. GIMC2001 TaxID=1513297 RepID=UPI0023497402|nr:RNA polymerase sigma factor [Leptospira sp. GIMC2001]WCL47748.1 RNA polymerase sigma factor [Leptospira sp. GIMC2001]